MHPLPRRLALDEENHRPHARTAAASSSDPDALKNVADNIAGRTICAFGEACAWPTQSFVAKFSEEFDARATKPLPPPMPPEYTPEELIEHRPNRRPAGPHPKAHESCLPAALEPIPDEH